MKGNGRHSRCRDSLKSVKVTVPMFVTCNIPFHVERIEPVRMPHIVGRRDRVSYCGSADCPGRRKCRPCRNAYARSTRPKHSEMSDEARKKANCRAYTHVLIKRGHLKRKPCERCGFDPAVPHHRNYDDPRDVEWLCDKRGNNCHRKEHKTERSDRCKCGDARRPNNTECKACHAADMKRRRKVARSEDRGDQVTGECSTGRRADAQ